MRLLISDDILLLSPTVSEFLQLDKFGTLCFLSHPLGGLGTTYGVQLGLIGSA